MGQFFFVLFMMACSLFSTPLMAADEPLSDFELQAYYNNLQEQIKRSEARVQTLFQNMNSKKNMPSDWARVEFEAAITTLEVKKTLYANFYDTESVKQSQAVRTLLLKTMSQDNIGVADLAALQSLVRQEKARLKLR